MKIIVIVCDTLRRDFLGCYGNAWVHTPNIDRLASESIIFDRAYIGSFPTMPHRAELMTGHYVFHTIGWAPLPPDEIVFQRLLQEQGYVTMLISDNIQMLAPGMNYHQGFDGHHWIRGHQADCWRTSHRPVKYPCDPNKLRQPEFLVIPHLRNNYGRLYEREWHDPQTIQAAIDWLEDNYRQDKFLLYLDLFGIHEPWDPPRWYIDLYDPGYEGEEVLLPRYDRADYLTEAELRHIRALYASMITMTDRWLGRLFEKLEILGLWDNTAILFTSDHGWYHGEHGLIGKHTVLNPKEGWPLYEEVAHVPLLIKLPDVKGGRRCQALVQPVDLMPTLVEMSGAEPPEGLHGRSLLPVLRGETDKVRDLAVSSPTLPTDPEYLVYSTITDGEWALIHGGARGKSELYHLRRDPSQAYNVIAEYSEVAQRLSEGYLALLERIGTSDEKLRLRLHL